LAFWLAALLLLGPTLSAARAGQPSVSGNSWTRLIAPGQRAVEQASSAAPAAATSSLAQPAEPQPAPSSAPASAGGGMSPGKRALLIAVIAAAGTVAIYAVLESKVLR
jgi:hypothetical protein